MTHRHPKTNVGSMLKLVELAQTRFKQAVDRDAIRRVAPDPHAEHRAVPGVPRRRPPE
jgi:hypothetical protein